MHANSLRLAELLATRLCHDLVGPLGGLAVALSEAPREAEALAIAQDAALALRRRFALLRAAWAEAGAPLGAQELAELALGLGNAHRLRVTIDLQPLGARLPPGASRAVVNALLLAAECLPRGGGLSLAGAPAEQVLCSIAGPSAAWPAGFGVLLRDPAAAWAAVAAARGTAGLRGLQAPLTALLADAAGVRASLLLAAAREAAPPLMLDCAAAV